MTLDDSLEVGYGRAWFRANGVPVIVIIAALVLVGGLGYFISVGFADMQNAHKQFATAQGDYRREIQLQTCVMSLTMDEKIALRTSMARLPGARVREAMVTFCPWLEPNH